MVLTTATINFGGINSSKLEFVDFSTEDSKRFFQNLQADFEALSAQDGEITLRKFITSHFTMNEIAYVNYLFDCASKFMRDCFSIGFLAELATDASSTSDFDLGSVHLNTFMTKVLRRDKGIGGFEQLCQSRPTNIGNINQFLDKDGITGKYTFNSMRYILAVKKYYFDQKGLDTSVFSKAKSYRDLFLKGRKEGENGSTRNYYTFFEKDDPLNGDMPNSERTTSFSSLANIVMMLYDIISMNIIIAKGEIVPSNIPEKLSPQELAATKTQFVINLVQKQNLDVLFVTECIPLAFAEHNQHLETLGYLIEYGEDTDGLCNAIIYKLQQFGVLEVNSVTEDVYSQQNEFKETPLHLMNSDGNFNLICYHANGKGVTVERPLAETSFYDWVSGLDGHVIVGGDLNMDFKKMGNELSALLDIGNISNGAFSCYKQRSPLQAQYDKAGVFDTKFCDYIITKGFIRTEVQVLAASSDGNTQQLNAEHNLSPDELVIPNNNYPFEHYIVMDHIVPIYSGFTFFSRNLPSLSWIDSMMNWALGY